jgi:D-proline reductase (dithiol) PrdB
VSLKRIFHQGLARLAGRWPALSDRLVASFLPRDETTIPWRPVRKPLAQSQIALVTTAGLHHRGQRPFDMLDPRGDPTFRVIDGATIEADYAITHDYYDHRDANRDINVVFPIARLKEMRADGAIGGVSARHFAFMGHITGDHVERLTEEFAPQVAAMAHQDGVDAVLLTPA